MRLALGGDEADRHAALARAAGAADAMRVIHRRARQIVIHHCRKACNVDAARRHIGRYQYLQAASLEIAQHFGARALAELTVEGTGADAVAVQLIRHMLGRIFGRDEHQHPAPLMLLDQMFEQLRAARHVNQDRALHDIRLADRLRQHFHARRLVQHAVRQRLHRRREGRREEQVLALLGQQLQDAAQLLAETQVQQAIRLVQHQHGHTADLQGVMVDQVQQPSRRGDDDVGAAAQRHHLRIDRHAAEHNRHLDRHRQMRHQPAHRLAHLRRQLARRHQDQAMQLTRAVAVLQQRMQQRQRECGSLAGAGLRGAQHILAAQDGGNGSALDRGRLLIADFGHSIEQGGSKAQRGKRHDGLR